MINTLELKTVIKDAGFSFSWIARQLNLTYPGFKKKLDGKSEFKISEFKKICDILKLDEEKKEKIFLKEDSENHWKAQSDEERARQELKEMGLIVEE